MAQQLTARDIVTYVGKASGKTIECEVCSLHGLQARVVWTADRNTYRMVNLSDLMFIRHHQSQPVASQQTTSYRYRCLSCGAKGNRQTCARCGAQDMILNTDDDLDKSYLLNH